MPATMPESSSFESASNTFFTPLDNIFSENNKIPSYTRKSRGTRKSTTVPKPPSFNFMSEPTATTAPPPPETYVSIYIKYIYY